MSNKVQGTFLQLLALTGVLCSGALPAAEFISKDINAMAGSTTQVGADGYDISGSGHDIWGTSDGFRFVFQRVSGDFEIRARVVSQQDTNEWAKAGVMVRQSLAPGSIFGMIAITPAKGCVFQRRNEPGGECENRECGAARPGNAWLRLTRCGKGVTVFMAADDDGKNWQKVNAEVLDLADPVLVGLFVSSHDTRVLSAASFRNVVLKTEAEAAPEPEAAAAPPEAVAESKPNIPGLSTLDSSAAKPPGAKPAAVGATPEERNLAAALAASAAKLVAAGKTDKARDLCFRALANDEDCAEALFELGKMFEKEGRSIAAGDFLLRAGRQFAKEEASNPTFGSKRLDAERRAKTLNPYGMRITSLMTDYALELGQIAKKVPDSLTQEELADRVAALQLASVVPADKLQWAEKLMAPKQPAKPATADEERRSRFVPIKQEAATSVPPDVERTLKTAGWTTITGAWKKKADNLYEVTDGRLEAPKLNGALQVTFYKGGTGSLKVMVRNKQDDDRGYFSWGSGYGFKVEGNTAKMYTPSSYYGLGNAGGFRPSMERELPLPSATPKFRLLVTINGGALDLTLNEKREHHSNYNLAKDGSFLIGIEGTVTIESPQVLGQ